MYSITNCYKGMKKPKTNQVIASFSSDAFTCDIVRQGDLFLLSFYDGRTLVTPYKSYASAMLAFLHRIEFSCNLF